MNELDELTVELAGAMAKQMANQADLNAVQANKDKLKAEVVELEKKIAEAKKPKLRHGNQYHDGCNGVIILKSGNKWRIEYDDEQFVELSEKETLNRLKAIKYVLVGNIFDNLCDLTAMQEDLTEFEMYSSKSVRNLSISGPNADGDVYVEIQERGHSNKVLGILRVSLDELSLNLQRMLATLKRNEAKK